MIEKLKRIPFEYRLKRLLYNCRKRGILENELILTNYLKDNPIDEKEISLMETFLMRPDWTLYKEMTGHGATGLMGKLQAYTHRRRPLRMPDLSSFRQ